MSIATILASALVVQAPAPAEGAVEVAYPEMVAGRTAAAIGKIEQADARDAAHPARLINLGIAHARMGDEEKARALFAEAAASGERYWLETATGEWVDSRDIARKATAMLDRGEFAGTRFASR
jgi:tetratricopeptide (TPR) repeat protein